MNALKTQVHVLMLSTGFFVLSFQTPAAQAASTGCKAVPWPYSRTESHSAVLERFNRLPEKDLFAYLYNDLTQPNDHSLAQPLLKFLRDRETDPLTRVYFDFLAEGAGIDPEDPKAAKAPQTYFKLSEICAVHQKVYNDDGSKKLSK